MQRSRKNILITGTPGVGKTTLAERAAAASGFNHINVSEFVKSHQLYEEYDAEFDTYVIDEDRVLDEMEPLMAQGGVIVDYHGADFFPERWFDHIVVLQCDNTVLYDRLVSRGYTQNKITENVECEIMQVILQEVMDSYQGDKIVTCVSNSVEDMDVNLQKTISLLQ